ncbi:UDP-N-acetylmuramoyl-L-alanyl-D-glutamate--2,6-diaminopimelate ligase [Candidatus Bipolaricaulota bacterium]|nr:UDP-N-acetylmuramoyl-L-alanyl-D-glutamate--2,6-diaminopimelate ligase [Candidatus Bipolaricaulota bacterium]
MAKSLAELASIAGFQPQPAWTRIVIEGICEDTRRLRPGDLFVAIPGYDRDGSDFIARAVERGAVAVLSEESVDLPVPVLKAKCARTALAQLSAVFYDHPTRELFAVGVTGTNGKTTTCHWTADLLGRSETLLLSTVRNPILAISCLTTPPSPIIQQLARGAVDDGTHNLILEASSAGIAQDRVSDIDFDACVFTNFSPEHLSHHNGLASYRSAKLKLFESLKPEAWAILNADDPMYPDIAAATPARVLTFGIDAGADLRAEDIQPEARSSRFTVVVAQEESETVFLPLPGRHNIFNALAAVGVGVVKKIPLPLIAKRLAQVEPIPGRTEYFRREDGLVAVVDFAHNASSLETTLRSLRSEYSRVIVLFGCPGDGEHEKRAAMGEVAGRYADAVVLTSDNPKNEDAHAIASEIQTAIGSSLVPVTIVLDRRGAIQLALSQAKEGDIVLLAGKGHETEQLVEDERVPFSDAEALRELGFTEGD